MYNWNSENQAFILVDGRLYLVYGAVLDQEDGNVSIKGRFLDLDKEVDLGAAIRPHYRPADVVDLCRQDWLRLCILNQPVGEDGRGGFRGDCYPCENEVVGGIPAKSRSNNE